MEVEIGHGEERPFDSVWGMYYDEFEDYDPSSTEDSSENKQI